MKTILLDASSLRHSACNLALHYTLNGIKPAGAINSIQIEFGSAFHLFRKLYSEGTDELVAIARAVHYFNTVPKTFTKTSQHLARPGYLQETCQGYNERYCYDEYRAVLSPESKHPLVEIRFVYPYYRSDNIEILLCGTIDEIVYNPIEGSYAIKDYKTTSDWNKDEYFRQYALSTQLLFYIYAVKKYASLFPAGIVAKICEKPLGAFIDGVFLGASKAAEFQRSWVIYPSADTMEEFEKGLEEKVKGIIEREQDETKLWREGMLNGSCKKGWGMCQYFDICSIGNKNERAIYRNENFVVSKYDPMKFGAEV